MSGKRKQKRKLSSSRQGCVQREREGKSARSGGNHNVRSLRFFKRLRFVRFFFFYRFFFTGRMI